MHLIDIHSSYGYVVFVCNFVVNAVRGFSVHWEGGENMMLTLCAC